MSKSTLLLVPSLFCGLALAHAVLPAAPTADAMLKAAEHEEVGGLIADWLDARIKKLDVVETKEALRAALEKWSKKRGVDGRDPLSLTEDLEAALWFSYGYDKAKGIKKGKVAEIESVNADSQKINFAFWAPAKYRPTEGPYPLVICIPAEGETPTAHLTERWVDANVRDGAILACVPMPEELPDWTSKKGLANFFAVMRDVTTSYAVDFDRIYVAGRGAGVATAMEIASRFPDRFAGVIGRTGDAATLGPENFRNMPTFFAGAGKVASEFQTACKDAGHDNVTLEPEAQEPAIWAWIQSHPRNGNPTKITLKPGTPFPERAYWLSVTPTDTQALITAEIDRAANKVTVEAKGVPQVTLSFNDLLVDLDKPVKVVCNGVEHEDLIPRNLEVFLERVRVTSNDPGKLYTASRAYDVPLPQ